MCRHPNRRQKVIEISPFERECHYYLIFLFWFYVFICVYVNYIFNWFKKNSCLMHLNTQRNQFSFCIIIEFCSHLNLYIRLVSVNTYKFKLKLCIYWIFNFLWNLSLKNIFENNNKIIFALSMQTKYEKINLMLPSSLILLMPNNNCLLDSNTSNHLHHG